MALAIESGGVTGELQTSVTANKAITAPPNAGARQAMVLKDNPARRQATARCRDTCAAISASAITTKSSAVALVPSPPFVTLMIISIPGNTIAGRIQSRRKRNQDDE